MYYLSLAAKKFMISLFQKKNCQHAQLIFWMQNKWKELFWARINDAAKKKTLQATMRQHSSNFAFVVIYTEIFLINSVHVFPNFKYQPYKMHLKIQAYQLYH